MSNHWKWVLSAALLLASWSETLAGQPLTLGSGKSIEILAVGPLQSTHGWSALMLKYRTSLPLTDVPPLRKEANEIWDRFVVDVEHSSYQTAVISANEPETGSIVSTNNSYNFVFEKKDGAWRTLESKERAQAKLDPDFVKEVVDRLDRALDYNEMNTLLLYMANDWIITITKPGEASSDSQTIDRMKFVTISHATLAAASKRQHRREITSISIGEAGNSARVESRETEEMTINNHQAAGVGRSTDLFELRGDVMLWTKSTGVIEKQTETPSNP
jgi:hypothetical protein